MTCQATAERHCCYVPHVGVCPHFDPNPPADAEGFCSLRYRLGSWEAVHISPEYAPQRAAFLAFPTSLCGDFPDPNESPCGECGAVNDA